MFPFSEYVWQFKIDLVQDDCIILFNICNKVRWFSKQIIPKSGQFGDFKKRPTVLDFQMLCSSNKFRDVQVEKPWVIPMKSSYHHSVPNMIHDACISKGRFCSGKCWDSHTSTMVRIWGFIQWQKNAKIPANKMSPNGYTLQTTTLPKIPMEIPWFYVVKCPWCHVLVMSNANSMTISQFSSLNRISSLSWRLHELWITIDPH